ncbi:MAG TPA: twin-arginine translocase TatA/TatE family subunit [Candidatus Methylacidiphilales bacterium]
MPHGLDFFWIFVALVLLFGAKKLPELARGLGKSLGEFKKAKDEFDREVKASIHDTPAQPATPTIQPPATTPVGTAVPHPTPIAPAPTPVSDPSKPAGH